MNKAKAILRALRKNGTVFPFHANWIRHAYSADCQIAALSCPRGSAKTWTFAKLATLGITPDSPTWENGVENLVVSGSLEQSRIMLSFIREFIGDRENDYRWLDSGQRLQITHKDTNTKLRVLSSSGKRAMGLAKFSTIFGDEPASWGEREGALMHDALKMSLGKRPEQRLFLIGTRSPAAPDNWWPNLLDGGSGPGTHIEVLTAPDDQPWDSWNTIRKVNPLVNVNPELRRTILRERDDARRNESLRPAFEAYRLNRQVDVEREVLVTVAAWRQVEARPVPPRQGRPICGLDVGAERSFSAAWLLWANGRSEAYALCPGLPDLAERERQDAQPRGLYRKLYQDGVLLVDENRHMSRISVLIDFLVDAGIRPSVMLCDRFLWGDLLDAVRGRWPVVERKTRWSEATEDIAAFRRLTLDGPMSIVEKCRLLARMSLSQASVRSEEGNVRVEKKRGRRSRDDIAIAGTLAAGELVRLINKPVVPLWRYRGAA